MIIKRVLAVLIVTIFAVMALTGCSGKKVADIIKDDTTTKSEAVVTEETTTVKADNDSKSSTKWRDFLKEYDEWADKYIALYKKYKANPLDSSLISEYTEMVQKAAEWSSKASDYVKELQSASPEELEEYNKIAEKISDKINKAIGE